MLKVNGERSAALSAHETWLVPHNCNLSAREAGADQARWKTGLPSLLGVSRGKRRARGAQDGLEVTASDTYKGNKGLSLLQ